MSARVVDIRSAIITELNHASRSWATAFTAAASYTAEYQRATIGTTIRMDVVALENEQSEAEGTPLVRQDEYAINLVYQVAVDPLDVNAIDAHVLRVQQIHDYYERTAAGKRKSITGLTNTWSIDPRVPSIYDVDKLIDEGIFLSVIELTIRDWRREAGNAP